MKRAVSSNHALMITETLNALLPWGKSGALSRSRVLYRHSAVQGLHLDANARFEEPDS